MNNKSVYWYKAQLLIKKDKLPVLFKSDYPNYVLDDCIKKRFRPGFVLTLRIVRPLGTETPNKKDYLVFPQIISEI